MINYFYLPCYSNFLSLITKLFLLRYFSKLFFFFRWRWQLPLNSLSQLPLYIVVIISSFSPPAMLGRKERKRERKLLKPKTITTTTKNYPHSKIWFRWSMEKEILQFDQKKKKNYSKAESTQFNPTQLNQTNQTKPTVIPQLCNFCLFHCHFILGLY